MGYYSKVYLKTTTEGYIILKRLNDATEQEEDQLFFAAEISKTKSDFYKIEYDYIKWYPQYKNVRNFMKGLQQLKQYDIPYSFIRIGEDVGDIERDVNYIEDTPEQITDFEPRTELYDPDTSYEISEQ